MVRNGNVCLMVVLLLVLCMVFLIEFFVLCMMML